MVRSPSQHTVICPACNAIVNTNVSPDGSLWVGTGDKDHLTCTNHSIGPGMFFSSYMIRMNEPTHPEHGFISSIGLYDNEHDTKILQERLDAGYKHFLLAILLQEF